MFRLIRAHVHLKEAFSGDPTLKKHMIIKAMITVCHANSFRLTKSGMHVHMIYNELCLDLLLKKLIKSFWRF